MRLGVTLEEMSEWAQANKAYDMFIEGYATSELLTEVRMRRAETILQQGDAAQAGSLFAEVAAVEGFEAADHALMRQAFCATRLDKMAEAAALYAVADRAVSASRRMCPRRRCRPAAATIGRRTTTRPPRGWTKVVAAGGEPAVEAAHWLCRIHLRAKHPEQVAAFGGLDPAAGRRQSVRGQFEIGQGGRAVRNGRPPRRRADRVPGRLPGLSRTRCGGVGPLQRGVRGAWISSSTIRPWIWPTSSSQAFADNALAPDARYIVAECQMQKKDYAQAETLYRALIDGVAEHPEKEPLAGSARVWSSTCRRTTRRPSICCTPLAPQLTAPDQKAEALYLIGLSHYQLGQFDEAATQLQAATAASSAWRQADETLLYLARAQHKLGQNRPGACDARHAAQDLPGDRAGRPGVLPSGRVSLCGRSISGGRRGLRASDPEVSAIDLRPVRAVRQRLGDR